MIHKKKDFSTNPRGRLNYIFNGAKHEHKVKQTRFIHGTAIAEPDKTDGGYDISDLENEFLATAAMHTGKGKKLFSHYIISLAPGEGLTDDQWQDVLTEYMRAMGYSASDTLYCGGVHNDTYKEHMHISACRVRMQPGGPLVSDKNDYQRGFNILRKLEQKYGVTAVQNPEKNWGHDYTKGEIKNAGGRENAKKHDEAEVIRARIKSIWAKCKPKTMSQFAIALAQAGIDIKVRCTADGNNKPLGISYKLQTSEHWIPGSKVKKSRLTWANLQKREHINYIPDRDNFALGISKSNNNNDLGISVYQPINKRVLFKYNRVQPPYQLCKRGNTYYVRLDFRARVTLLQIARSRNQITRQHQFKGLYKSYSQLAIEDALKIVLAAINLLLRLLFGVYVGQPVYWIEGDKNPGMQVVNNPPQPETLSLGGDDSALNDMFNNFEWARASYEKVETNEPYLSYLPER